MAAPTLLSALFAVATLLDPGGDDQPDASLRETARPLAAARDHGVGRRLPDVTLTHTDGSTTTLAELVGDGWLVLSMREVDCPLSKKLLPRLARLEQQWGERDVRFAYLDSSALDTPDEVAASAERAGLGGLQFVDPQAQLAARLGVTTTTEVLLVDRTLTLRYRGAVDDQYGLTVTRPEPRRQFLADALAAALDGRRAPVLLTSAPGCLIDAPEIDVEPETPTWHGDVSRLVQDACQSCHRSGGVAPFALESAADLAGRRGMIAFAVETGLMPPWNAHGGGPWLNDRSLSEADRERLVAWLEADCPEGDPAHAPLPVRHPTGWTIGEPDVVYEGRAIDVPAEGVLPYHYYYVKTDEPEDRWVEAVEIRAGAGAQVHHVLVFLEDPPLGQGDQVSTRGDGGLSGYFAGYIPGQGGRDFGEGFAKKLPAGAWLKFQLHYTTNGEAVTDVSSIGLRFAAAPPEHEVRTSGLAETRFQIPPRHGGFEVTAEGSFRSEATLAGFSPHMHLRGKSFRFDLLLPDGTSETLLDVPRYDFNWQTMYRLAEPRVIPAGSKLRCTAVFDNSADNPSNPDPSKEVWFGEQTWDEMMIGYFEWWRE